MDKYKIVVLAILILAVVSAAFLMFKFYGATANGWICQNNQWVKRGNPAEPRPTSGCGDAAAAEIIVDSPRPDQTIASPLTVRGKARGGWFFEASFPVELVDSQNNRLGQSFVQAQSDWMTADFVSFLGQLNYEAAATTSGRLILSKDNPSGLPQFDKSFIVPVIINPSQTIILKAFFNNNNLDPRITCVKVFAVERRLPKTVAVARAALEELLKGPTAEEQAQGYFTNINSGVKIQKLTIEQGIAEVDFDEQLQFQAGGSCRVGAIRAQISETLKQFATVKNVVISINGRSEDILQP